MKTAIALSLALTELVAALVLAPAVGLAQDPGNGPGNTKDQRDLIGEICQKRGFQTTCLPLGGGHAVTRNLSRGLPRHDRDRRGAPTLKQGE